MLIETTGPELTAKCLFISTIQRTEHVYSPNFEQASRRDQHQAYERRQYRFHGKGQHQGSSQRRYHRSRHRCQRRYPRSRRRHHHRRHYRLHHRPSRLREQLWMSSFKKGNTHLTKRSRGMPTAGKH